MSWLSVFSSREAQAVVFVACITFTIVACEAFRWWLERGPVEGRRARANAIAAALSLVFLVMVIMGVADWVATKPRFLNLTLFLTGTVGLAIVLDLLVRFHASKLDTREARKIAAHDL